MLAESMLLFHWPAVFTMGTADHPECRAAHARQRQTRMAMIAESKRVADLSPTLDNAAISAAQISATTGETAEDGHAWVSALVTVVLLLGTDVAGQEVAGGRASAPQLVPLDLPLTDTVLQHGITWKFQEKVRVGRFVNGNYYVVGPVTVVAITPRPESGRNGSVLNLPPVNARSGFDSRVVGGRYDPKLPSQLPVAMKPGDALVSSISVARMGELPAPLRPSDRSLGPVRSVSILTCLAEPVPANAYPEAVDLAFGGHAKYGQIVKDYRNATMTYTPSEMVGAERTGIFGIREDEERSICTSHVERHNLTIRTLMKRFTRLGLRFYKKLENHEAACAMFLAYYNFCWRTRMPGNSGRYRLPAALAAGVVNELWSFERLYDEVMGETPQTHPRTPSSLCWHRRSTH